VVVGSGRLQLKRCSRPCGSRAEHRFERCRRHLWQPASSPSDANHDGGPKGKDALCALEDDSEVRRGHAAVPRALRRLPGPLRVRRGPRTLLRIKGLSQQREVRRVAADATRRQSSICLRLISGRRCYRQIRNPGNVPESIKPSIHCFHSRQLG
jgi:hypothetical protein